MENAQPPFDFLWGVATSAYQSEGGYNGKGEPQTNWGWAECDGDVTPSGKAAEFWTRYPDDFKKAQKLGLNAFRLGIEWSRVQPSFSLERSKEPPEFDFAALHRYAEMIAEAYRTGLELVVTLHHFVHPAWLGRDPWLEGETAELFKTFVLTSVEYLNSHLIDRLAARPIRYFITINEPNMLVLNTYAGNQFPTGAARGIENASIAWSQLMRAHVIVYNALHDLYQERGWQPPSISLNNYCSDLYWSDKLWLDLLEVRRKRIPRESVHEHVCAQAQKFSDDFRNADLPLHKDVPFYIGKVVKWVSDRFARRFFDPQKIQPFLDAIYESKREQLLDYVGLDYYDPFGAHIFRLPVWWDHEFKNKSVRSWLMNSVTSKWWDWRVLPRGLHFFCELYYREYQLPVLIAENGMAQRRRYGQPGEHRRDRISRSDFLRLHVLEIERIRNEGVPLVGYLHWSLFDNYEWGTFTPRFGLFTINYESGTDRIAVNEYGDEPSRTYAELIAESRTAERESSRSGGLQSAV